MLFESFDHRGFRGVSSFGCVRVVPDGRVFQIANISGHDPGIYQVTFSGYFFIVALAYILFMILVS